MPDIPLPKGLVGLSDLPKQRETMTNLFFNGSGIIRRPGIATFLNDAATPTPVLGSGICRGAEKFTRLANGQTDLYQVSGTNFIRIEEDGTVTIIGVPIPGTVRVIFAKTINFLVFITVGGGTAFYYDGQAQTLTQSTVPLGGYRDVIVSENRFIYVLNDGSAIEVSEDTSTAPNVPDTIAGSFNPEDFPDLNTGAFNNNGDIFFGGTESFQLFRFNPIVGVDIPFTKVPRGTDNTGYVSGKTIFGASFAFLGQPKGESYGFFVKGQGDSARISNDAVAEILNNEYVRNELEDCVGARIFWLDNEIIIFQLARHTFIFTNGNWALVQSGIVAQELTANWRGNYPIFIYDRYIVGDTVNNRIGFLSNVFKEYDGVDITDNLLEWKFRTFGIFPTNSFISFNAVEIDCLVGTGKIDLTIQPEEIIGVIGLALSKDGVVFQRDNEMVRSLGAAGEYRRRVRFTAVGGIGTYQDMIGMEFRGTAPVNFSLQAIKLGDN